MTLKIMKFIYLNKLKFKIMKKTERRKTFFVLYKTKKNENLPCIWMRNYKRVIHLKKINILCGEICCLDIQRILEKKNEILKIYEIILII